MTPLAQQHLEKAKDLLGRGQSYYRRAAVEIAKAKEAGATNKEAGLFLGYSEGWVRTILAWRDSSYSSTTPFSGQADRINLRKTKQRLREASPEELAAIIASLPDDALDRLAAVLLPKRPRRKRSNVWTGPRRRLRLLGIVREMVADASFVRSEVGEMELSAADEATLAGLLNQIEAEVGQVRASLGQAKRTATLRAVR